MIVVDTNVVSELMRPSPSAVVVGWVRGNERELSTTSITLAEIRYGIERLADGRRKELLRSTAEEVFADSAERVLCLRRGGGGGLRHDRERLRPCRPADRWLRRADRRYLPRSPRRLGHAQRQGFPGHRDRHHRSLAIRPTCPN
jgi:predicted nucleic acid-binding protein